MISLDISKALDKVWHVSLIHRSIVWLVYWTVRLDNRLLEKPVLKAVIDGHSTEIQMDINAGVPQGFIFAATLLCCI